MYRAILKRFVSVFAIVLFLISFLAGASSKFTNTELVNDFSVNLNQPHLESLAHEEIHEILPILRVGERFREPNYDPLDINNMVNYRRNSLLFNGLVGHDPETGELIPVLATQWTVSAEDSKEWTFDLREDVIFHDGSEFNASSVQFTYNRILDSTHPAHIPMEEFPLESINIVNEFRLIFNFNVPYAPFINVEAVSLKIISPNSFDGMGNLIRPIGTGPYMLDITASNDEFQNFTRFVDYFNGLPPFEQIHYYTFGESLPNLWETFDQNLLAHDFDFTSTLNLPLRDTIPLEFVRNDDYWEVTEMQEGNAHGVGFINHQNAVLSNRLVRIALNYAINRTEFIEDFIFNTGTPMKNLVPPGIPFVDNSIPGYPYDESLANNLLDQAGYPIGSDEYRFDLQLSSTSLSEPRIQRIATYLKNVGINATTYVPSDFSAHFDGAAYEIMYFGSLWRSDPNELWYYVHPDGDFNPGGYSNDIVTELLDLGKQTPVKQEREYYYNQLQQKIHSEAPHLYISDSNLYFAASKDVIPYVVLNKLMEYDFTYLEVPAPLEVEMNHKLSNYRITQDSKLFIMKNVEIASKPIYFPFTDAVVSSDDQNILTITMRMTHQLNNLLPDQVTLGKFYDIQSDSEEIQYHFRAYYDPEEVEQGDLSLYIWNTKLETWKPLRSFSVNTIFRYVEVELNGSALLKLAPTPEITPTTSQETITETETTTLEKTRLTTSKITSTQPTIEKSSFPSVLTVAIVFCTLINYSRKKKKK